MANGRLYYNLRKEEETLTNLTIEQIAEYFKCSVCHIRTSFTNNEERIYGYTYELTDECKDTKEKQIPEYLLQEWEEVRKLFLRKRKHE